ncbi:MAG TPA: hypothetical protein VFL93_15075, partial [Longimicrobiaceae bacterium]|nr:hypothetical protein [Longimicrobiaceae bacterium]
TRGFFEPEVDLTVGRRWAPREATLTVAGRAGAVLGDAPTQALFPFGGRGTVPGYGFRGFAGERFVTLSATASAYLWRPWVRGRLLGAIGRVGRDDSDLTCPANASCPPALGGSGWKPSLGIGVGLVNDILRVDLSRGLAADGRWEVVVDANPSFWDFL